MADTFTFFGIAMGFAENALLYCFFKPNGLFFRSVAHMSLFGTGLCSFSLRSHCQGLSLLVHWTHRSFLSALYNISPFLSIAFGEIL